MLLFMLNQIKTMVMKSEWALSKQTLAAPKEAMELTHNLNADEYSNISIGIQFNPKTKDTD